MDNDDNKRGKYNEKYDLNALNNLNLIMEDKEYWMTSLQLAEISGRNHFHVLRDIDRDLNDVEIMKTQYIDKEDKSRFGFISTLRIKESINRIIYKEHVYIDSMNREKKLYYLNREASLLCLTRYHRLIQILVNDAFLESINDKIEILAEKAKRYEHLMNSNGTFSMGVVAKSFALKDMDGSVLGRNKLFEILRNNKVLQSSKSDWNIPYQNYIKNGYFRVLFKTVKDDITIATTRITPKGLEFLHDLIITLGYSYEGSIYEIETFVSNDDYSDDNIEYK